MRTSVPASTTGHGVIRRALSSRPARPARRRPGGSGVPGIWSAEYRLLTAGLLLTIASFAFEAMAVATALPVTLRELGGLPLYGWAFSAMQLTTLLGTVLGGMLADRLGLTRPFAAGVGLFAAGLVLAGVAPSMGVVVAGRAVQGLGGGLVASAAYVAMSRGYAAATRARILAALSTAWVVPGLVGPMIAGAVADHLSWRLIFLALVPLMPVAAAMAMPALRRIDRLARPAGGSRHEATVRAWLALGLTAGAGLLLAGLGGAGSPAVGGPLAAGGLALIALTLPRLLPAGTLRARRGLPAAIATAGLLCLGFFGAEAFLPLALTTVHGVSTTRAGLAVGMAALTWAGGSWIAARLTAAGRRGVVITAGALIVTVAVAGAVAATVATIPPVLTTVAWAAGGIGMGLAFSTTSLVILETAEPGQEGAAAAALQLSQTLGAGVGTGVGGALVALSDAAGWGAAAGIRLVDALALAAVLLAVVAGSRTPRRLAAPAEPEAATATRAAA